MKSQILYFLGWFYYKNNDILTAKNKLKKCIKLKYRSSVKPPASELLSYIWNYHIRPRWWQWWLFTPTYSWLNWPKKILFFCIVLLLVALLFYPFIPEGTLTNFIIQNIQDMASNQIVYISAIVFLIFLLLSPSLVRFKVKVFEFELLPPPSFNPKLSPIIIENKLRENENFLSDSL